MNTIARSFTRLVAASAFVAVIQLIALPAAAAARPDENARGLWLASSGPDPGIGTNWGRLALRDGVLTFNSTGADWQIAVSEITRVAISEQSDRLIVIEAAGRTHYIAILGQQMLVDSPRQALSAIQKALKAPAARRE